MHYDGSFVVPVAKQKVYDFVMDPAKITSIFPDVQDVKVIDESNFTLKAKVGISFIRGMMDVKMNIVERTPPSFARMKAKGNGMSSSVELDNTFTIEDAPGAEAIEEIRRTAVKQLRMIVIGVNGWRSSP